MSVVHCPKAGHRVRRASAPLGFTLIEVLVVVVIIALLLAILLPSLAKAREQARQAVCLSNLHQFGNAFSLYSADHKQFLPMVGYDIFKYYMKHNHDRVNAGALYGNKYAGKDLDIFFCPSNPLVSKGDWWLSGRNYGGSGFLSDHEVNKTTFMAYIYAIPMAGSWRDNDNQLISRHPRDAGRDTYPDIGNEDPDDRGNWKLLTRYRVWLRAKRVATGNPQYGKRNVYALMADNYIASKKHDGIGCGYFTHKNGYNVGYTDFHARFVRETPMPKDASGTVIDKSIALPQGPGSRSYKCFGTWDYFSKNP